MTTCPTSFATFSTIFHIFCWNHNFLFSILRENELGDFILNVGTVTSFIRNNLIQTDEVKDIAMGLDLLPDLFEFMPMSYIDDHQQYQEVSSRQEDITTA